MMGTVVLAENDWRTKGMEGSMSDGEARRTAYAGNGGHRVMTVGDATSDGIKRAQSGLISELYRMLDKRDMTRSQLARVTGDSSTMSVRTFTPETNVTLRTMVRNAEALGCDVRITLVPKEGKE